MFAYRNRNAMTETEFRVAAGALAKRAGNLIAGSRRCNNDAFGVIMAMPRRCDASA